MNTLHGPSSPLENTQGPAEAAKSFDALTETVTKETTAVNGHLTSGKKGSSELTPVNLGVLVSTLAGRAGVTPFSLLTASGIDENAADVFAKACAAAVRQALDRRV